MSEQGVMKFISKISAIEGALIDKNFLQGFNAVEDQIRHRMMEDFRNSFTGDFIIDAQRNLFRLHETVKPYQLPEEYIFFLAYCGGALIKKPNYNCIIEGIGPMVEEWYGFVMNEELPYTNGLFPFSVLVLKGYKPSRYVYFLFDLAGHFKQNSIVSIRSWELQNTKPTYIMKKPSISRIYYHKQADSFVIWLDQLIETGGSFDYVF